MCTQPYVLNLPALSGLPSQAGYSLPGTRSCRSSCPSLPVPIPFLLLLSQNLDVQVLSPTSSISSPRKPLPHPVSPPLYVSICLALTSHNITKAIVPPLFTSPCWAENFLCARTVSYLFLDFLCLPQGLI